MLQLFDAAHRFIAAVQNATIYTWELRTSLMFWRSYSSGADSAALIVLDDALGIRADRSPGRVEAGWGR
jgi:hypothetical protein